MDPERWGHIKDVYLEALGRTGVDRQAFLRERCAGDEALRREVQALLDQSGATKDLVGLLGGPELALAAGLDQGPERAAVIGKQIGPYQVQAMLGAGAMGEVYRARDAKLSRDVAIKMLHAAVAGDADRRRRLEQEARILASLNHPNIAAIYGLEDSGDPALVLELVEGETLRDRLSRGRMPVSTVLSVARQIADALDAAHSRNIIHRDLKPGNIKLTPDGVVKVLDLGIAKVLSDGESRDAITALTSAGTRTGTIVGTVAYMSPEQARGGAIDKRSDIWAFGCVLYEMLTGRRAYSGDDVSDVATGHDPRPPDFELLPSDTPVAVQRLLRRCLEPDPKRRLRDIADAWAELEDSQAPLPARAPRVLGEVRWPLWVAAAAVVVVLGIGVAIAPRLQLSPVDQSVREFSLEPPEGTNFSNGIALSPDGRRLAFVAGNAFGGNSFRPNTLWVRELDALHADEIAGTSGAQLPFWKPDGSAIGFFSNGKLMTVRLDVRQPVPLTDIPFPPSGGSWNSAGVIIFAGHRSGVFSIPETGGSPKPVTRLRPAQDLAHMWPQFLPDGDRFLYLVLGEKAANRGTYVASLSAPESKRIFTSRELVQYASPGWLVFPRNGQLRAQRFDADRLEVSGDELLVADSVWTVSPEGGAAVSVSGETLMYRVAGTRATSQPVWFDRTGNRLGVVGEPGQYQSIALSRDGSQLAAELHDLRTWDGDLHIFDLRRGGSRSRLTVDGVHNGQPVWSQKGDRILYTGRPAGEVNLHVKALGSDIDEALLPRGPDRSATDWSPDGFHILYDERASEDASGLRTQFDLWTLKLPERAPRRLLSS